MARARRSGTRLAAFHTGSRGGMAMRVKPFTVEVPTEHARRPPGAAGPHSLARRGPGGGLGARNEPRLPALPRRALAEPLRLARAGGGDQPLLALPRGVERARRPFHP